ncbi:MAG: hypothetical protein J0H04_12150, partial [Hyphomicrobium denitrificans]|nr:hypothetical protein [Hyphomicrobium denitrificans]
VSGNLLRNLVRRPHPATGKPAGGVGISVEGDVAITGNTIEKAALAGLALGWGPSLRDVSATSTSSIVQAGIIWTAMACRSGRAIFESIVRLLTCLRRVASPSLGSTSTGRDCNRSTSRRRSRSITQKC